MNEGSKKNVLIIVADQFRYDCMGFSNEIPVLTPNLDALAEESTFFENAYTSIPTCCPARQSFYACKRSESFGSYWNYDVTMPIGGLPVEEYSFVRDFKESGYNTIHIGRSELNPLHDCTEYGYVRQRDTWEEYRLLHGENRVCRERKHLVEGWVEECDISETPTGFTAACAIEEIKNAVKTGPDPFFMTVCFSSPHPPYRPHRSFYEMYDRALKWGGFDDPLTGKPYIQRQQIFNWKNGSKSWEDWEPIVRKYYAQISELDHHIGQMIGSLKDLGIKDETTIVFTSDHGDMCGDHKMFDKHYVLYEDVIHVPLIVKPANGTCRHVPRRTGEYTMHNLDLGPTLMELNHIDPSGTGLHGISFTDVLSGSSGVRREAVSSLNGAQFGLFTQRCIKTDRWKYIWNAADTDELYNLCDDPWETDNLIHESALTEVIGSLRARLLEVLCREGDPFCLVSRQWAAQIHLEENLKI